MDRYALQLSQLFPAYFMGIWRDEDGPLVYYAEAMVEIAKRDAEIERLKKQLAACASGPWRKPTDEEQEWINQCEYFEDIELTAYGQEKIVYQQHIHAPLYIATINPPEATQ